MSLIELLSITKTFAGVTALNGASLAIQRGQCHGLLGENGAGKSTLGKILAGIHRPDSGRILIDGQERVFRTPADARAAGIGMVHQEL
ncbi:MAG TPA: ATP-binding cassette domain-containing protein, partial [Tepidisphaeraceae bacterium]|nr:ATP-binding cassette domain-containing protein [Tepidisphaeraceae bacterium]